MDKRSVFLFTLLTISFTFGKATNDKKKACCQYTVLSLNNKTTNSNGNDANSQPDSSGTIIFTSLDQRNLTLKTAGGNGNGNIDKRKNGSDVRDNDLLKIDRSGHNDATSKNEMTTNDSNSNKNTNFLYTMLTDSKNRNGSMKRNSSSSDNNNRSNILTALGGTNLDFVDSRKNNSGGIVAKIVAALDKSDGDDNNNDDDGKDAVGGDEGRILAQKPIPHSDDDDHDAEEEEPQHGKLIADGSNSYRDHHDLQDPTMKIVIVTGNPRDRNSNRSMSKYPVTLPPRTKAKSPMETFITVFLLCLAFGGCIVVFILAFYPHCKAIRRQYRLNRSDSLEESGGGGGFLPGGASSRQKKKKKKNKEKRSNNNIVKTENTYYVGTDLNDYEDKFVSFNGYRKKPPTYNNDQATSMLSFHVDDDDDDDVDNDLDDEDTCSVPFTPVSERAPSPIPLTATPTMIPRRNANSKSKGQGQGQRLQKEATSADSSCAKKLPRTSTHRYSNYNNMPGRSGHVSSTPSSSSSSSSKIVSPATHTAASPTTVSSSWPSWDDSGLGKGNSRRLDFGNGNDNNDIIKKGQHHNLKDISNVHNSCKHHHNNSNVSSGSSSSNLIRNHKILKTIEEDKENSKSNNNNDDNKKTSKNDSGLNNTSTDGMINEEEISISNKNKNGMKMKGKEISNKNSGGGIENEAVSNNNRNGMKNNPIIMNNNSNNTNDKMERNKIGVRDRSGDVTENSSSNKAKIQQELPDKKMVGKTLPLGPHRFYQETCHTPRSKKLESGLPTGTMRRPYFVYPGRAPVVLNDEVSL